MAEPSLEIDRRDIAAALGGNDAAYAVLMGRYQAEVFRWMWRFSRDRGTVDELTQDVFVEAFRSLPGYAGRAPFAHWLCCIATRVGYRYWRRRARERERFEPLTPAHEATLRQPGAAAPTEAAECLYRLLEGLPVKDRLVLTLHYFDGLDTLDIAERLGWSHTLTRVRMHRARKRLKDELETLGFAR